MRMLLVLLLLTSCPQDSGVPPASSRPGGDEGRLEAGGTPVAVAKDLEVPWSIAFASADRILFTERPGRVRAIEGGQVRTTPLLSLTNVVARGEAGLMGMALHPDYARNRFVYLCYATEAGGKLVDDVVRYKDEGAALTQPQRILAGIPAARFHAGCRLKFGPDRRLYITTGDATSREIAQDLKSLGGKILRLNDDGSVPADNSFPGSPVWSYGHRNPQGIDWDPESGLLFETEHGPSGFDGGSGGDEVNIVERGNNYGWPRVHHEETGPGFVPPLLLYTPAHAPASGAFWKGDFYFGCLRGEHLHRLVLDKTDRRKVVRQEELFGELGRIREVAVGPDGSLYFSTSNRDGRGDPRSGDDKILKITAPPS